MNDDPKTNSRLDEWMRSVGIKDLAEFDLAVGLLSIAEFIDFTDGADPPGYITAELADIRAAQPKDEVELAQLVRARHPQYTDTDEELARKMLARYPDIAEIFILPEITEVERISNMPDDTTPPPITDPLDLIRDGDQIPLSSTTIAERARESDEAAWGDMTDEEVVRAVLQRFPDYVSITKSAPSIVERYPQLARYDNPEDFGRKWPHPNLRLTTQTAISIEVITENLWRAVLMSMVKAIRRRHERGLPSLGFEYVEDLELHSTELFHDERFVEEASNAYRYFIRALPVMTEHLFEITMGLSLFSSTVNLLTDPEEKVAEAERFAMEILLNLADDVEQILKRTATRIEDEINK